MPLALTSCASCSAPALSAPLYAMDVRALRAAFGLSSPLGGLYDNRTMWQALALLSAAASGYHGYKRNDSVGWAVVWFMLGGMFPVITPVVAVAQGFGEPAR